VRLLEQFCNGQIKAYGPREGGRVSIYGSKAPDLRWALLGLEWRGGGGHADSLDCDTLHSGVSN
jgi:hypothetical protein